MWTIIDHVASVASIIGALLGAYILLRELRMASEVHVLRAEEATQHQKEGKRAETELARRS